MIRRTPENKPPRQMPAKSGSQPMSSNRQHLNNLMRYLAVGGTAAIVDLSIFWIFAIHYALDYLLVAGFGFLLATAVNYHLCVRFIYISGQRFSGSTELFSVYFASAIGLVLHEVAIYLIHEHLAVPLLGSKILAIGLVFIWNFGIRNFYVFAAPASRESID
jgi:putative flippase GtrA